MRRFIVSKFARTAAVGVSIVAGFALTAPAALAHESVKAGPLAIVVGWGTEPAYAGFMNSVQMRISGADGSPVTDVPSGAIKVEVSSGTEKTTLSMTPNFRVGVFGDPGDYRAFMIPTRAGSYTFTFTGTARGQKVAIKVVSGETTFDDIKDPGEVQFPAKDPTIDELKQRIDREIPRIEAQLASRLTVTTDSSASAKTFGYVGIGLGVVALLLAIAALARKRG